MSNLSSLCNPYTGEHAWVWCSGDTLGEPQMNQECACGAFLCQGRDKAPLPEKGFDVELEQLAINEYLSFEEQD